MPIALDDLELDETVAIGDGGYRPYRNHREPMAPPGGVEAAPWTQPIGFAPQCEQRVLGGSPADISEVTTTMFARLRHRPSHGRGANLARRDALTVHPVR